VRNRSQKQQEWREGGWVDDLVVGDLEEDFSWCFASWGFSRRDLVGDWVVGDLVEVGDLVGDLVGYD